MPQQIDGGFSSQKYGSSTRIGVKIGGVIAKKLIFFHIPHKRAYRSFEKYTFSCSKNGGPDKLDQNIQLNTRHPSILCT